jgi:hypothetical protein
MLARCDMTDGWTGWDPLTDGLLCRVVCARALCLLAHHRRLLAEEGVLLDG